MLLLARDLLDQRVIDVLAQGGPGGLDLLRKQ
jgi:hypothetical protein